MGILVVLPKLVDTGKRQVVPLLCVQKMLRGLFKDDCHIFPLYYILFFFFALNAMFIKIVNTHLALYDNALLELHCVMCAHMHAHSFLKVFCRELYLLKTDNKSQRSCHSF